MIDGRLMRIGVGVVTGIHVDDDVGDLLNVVEDRVPDRLGDGMALERRQIAINGDVSRGLDPMADPTKSGAADLDDTRLGRRPFNRVGQGRVDGVHEPAKDLDRRAFEDPQDRHRDQESDDRVGLGGEPRKIPSAPNTTASEVRPSVRAW